jgi:hypothetical protein
MLQQLQTKIFVQRLDLEKYASMGPSFLVTAYFLVLMDC